MNLKSFHIRNFRRLRDVHIELDSPTSIFVGSNNSGKTSATHVFQLLLVESGERLSIHDFSSDCWKRFNLVDTEKPIESNEPPSLPAITLDLWFEVQEGDLHRMIDLLPSLGWESTLVGVRIELAAKDTSQLIANYREAKNKAQKGRSNKEAEGSQYQPWPKSMADYLSKRLSVEFEKRYYVLDRAQFDENLIQKKTYVPLQLGDNERNGAKILKTLLRVDFLSAQRHISDISSSGRSEDLSKRLGKFYERNLQQRNEDETFEAIRALAGSEAQLNAHLEKVFAPTLERLNNLGYPGFFDPHLVIRSALNPETIMKQNAEVHYSLSGPGQAAEDIVLPDKYNGLGFKNLIYMVIEVLDFHSRWVEEKEDRAPLHLVVIEEPEAHLHAQLQQVFIRKILEILPKEVASELFTTQLVVTTHSPHIIYESGFTPIRYFRRLNKPDTGQSSEVLNLSAFYGTTKEETRDFLQQYMKLTHCDLFFADAAILVEGNVERLLLPLMIGKAAPKLQLSYLSILEVGGAFAHRFRGLIEFLGLTTLVVTDLDSVSANKADQPRDANEVVGDDEGTEMERGKSCMAGEAGAETSNQTLIQWLPRLSKISELLAVTKDAKTQNATESTPANVRVCYQTLREISWKKEKALLTGRTLEESFALENLEWCQQLNRKPLQLKVTSESKTSSLEDLAKKLFARVGSSSFHKTEFALGLMGEDPKGWKVPAYIEEGLLWLSAQMETPKTASASDSPKPGIA